MCWTSQRQPYGAPEHSHFLNFFIGGSGHPSVCLTICLRVRPGRHKPENGRAGIRGSVLRVHSWEDSSRFPDWPWTPPYVGAQQSLHWVADHSLLWTFCCYCWQSPLRPHGTLLSPPWPHKDWPWCTGQQWSCLQSRLLGRALEQLREGRGPPGPDGGWAVPLARLPPSPKPASVFLISSLPLSFFTVLAPSPFYFPGYPFFLFLFCHNPLNQRSHSWKISKVFFFTS